MSYYTLHTGTMRRKPHGVKYWATVTLIAFVALCLLFADNANLLWLLTTPFVEGL